MERIAEQMQKGYNKDPFSNTISISCSFPYKIIYDYFKKSKGTIFISVSFSKMMISCDVLLPTITVLADDSVDCSCKVLEL